VQPSELADPSDRSLHSPIRQQYLRIKRQHPDALLFFRMGDFFEMFDEDAELGARELELTLTKREWGRGEKSFMAGVPHHAADSYIARLLARGHRVAVCEQLSDPTLAKGLVEREVVRVITPGTVVDLAMLSAKRNNFLAAAVMGRDCVGIAYADITTGEFACTQFLAAQPEVAMAQELERLQPAEVLVEAPGAVGATFPAASVSPSTGEDDFAATESWEGESSEPAVPWASTLEDSIRVTPLEARAFREDNARLRLLEHFGVTTLEAFGCDAEPLAIRAAGAIVAYLRETQRDALAHFASLETYSTSGFMALDTHTRRNLEIFESGRSGNTKGSLLWVLDTTRTPMGGRLLRRWLGEPLLDLARLRQRQDAVDAAYHDSAARARLIPVLARVGDLERLTSRAMQRIATPRDLVALAGGLRALEQLFATAWDVPAGLAPIVARIETLPELVALIERALVTSPPQNLSDGGVIRPGYSTEVDEISAAAENARQWVARLESSERERTGIANLKVGYNRVFGYYLEITNSQLGRVPDNYIRKQTLTTGERFITPELKEYEAQILTAHDRIIKLEQELFSQLRAGIAAQWSERILQTARALAELDVVLALGEVASRQGYCRPQLDEGDTIHIVAGRHPVVEASQRDTPFIPNDTHICTSDEQILLLTGPNMAGKSTYLRQVALITLLAQMGSFVPAEAARIGLTDRIFTRIGAQDDLATGQSTFMVEMVETANILHHATQSSLVILDEIGRGTSTYDGLAIARAIVEYLHNNKRCGAKTLFATHYHELVELSQILPRVKAYNVAVSEVDGRVIFLRKIVPGGTDKSYGIHVAQIAGIPRQVVRRAEEVLEELERYRPTRGEATGLKGRRRAVRDLVMPEALQLMLFAGEPDPLVEEIKALSIDELTPLEAISRLYELQRKARER
jgi:DNA mismatch repair protein MutS